MSDEIAITNLNFRTSIDDIYQAFSKFGDLQTCRLLLNDRNESKGYAFISYRRNREAHEAIHEMNGFHMDGREIRVAWSMSSANSVKEREKEREWVRERERERDIGNSYSNGMNRNYSNNSNNYNNKSRRNY